MRIAIVGAKGFVGKKLLGHLVNGYDAIPVTRDTVDLLNPSAVRSYLEKNKFDVVIDAAITLSENHLLNDTRNNLGLFMNLYNNSDLYGKFINFGSGAEFDRETNIDLASEDLIFDRMPADSYGFGLNVKSRLCFEKENFYTLRIFNCFGLGERTTRIFPQFLSKQQEPVFEIHNDRYFDYFSIQDLYKVVDHYLTQPNLLKDVNCVYKEKYKISEVISLFSKLNNLNQNARVVSESKNNYTGQYQKLESLNLNLEGLEKGLSQYV